MNDELLEWAKERYNRLQARKRLAEHDVYMAHCDLMGVRDEHPSEACLERFYEWKGMQPKKGIITDG